MLKYDGVIVVEGKYDRIRLSGVVEAAVVTTEGFGVFNDGQRVALIRRLARERGALILTDSDRAGAKIRGFLKGALPPDKITNAYIPALPGKEPRKASRSKDGFLGVEGLGEAELRRVLLRFGAYEGPGKANEASSQSREPITKSDLYAAGLSGGEGSAGRRESLCRRLGLPHLSANALLEAANILMTREEFMGAAKDI